MGARVRDLEQKEGEGEEREGDREGRSAAEDRTVGTLVGSADVADAQDVQTECIDHRFVKALCIEGQEDER